MALMLIEKIILTYFFENLNEEEIKFLLDRGDDTNLSISYFNNHVKFLESLVLKIPSKWFHIY